VQLECLETENRNSMRQGFHIDSHEAARSQSSDPITPLFVTRALHPEPLPKIVYHSSRVNGLWRVEEVVGIVYCFDLLEPLQVGSEVLRLGLSFGEAAVGIVNVRS
jgi:hypothetical protein